MILMINQYHDTSSQSGDDMYAHKNDDLLWDVEVTPASFAVIIHIRRVLATSSYALFWGDVGSVHRVIRGIGLSRVGPHARWDLIRPLFQHKLVFAVAWARL